MMMRTRRLALLGLGFVASVALAADKPAARPAAPVSPAVTAAPANQAAPTATAAATDAAAGLAADAQAQVAANPIPVRDDNAAAVTVNADGSITAVADASLMETSVARLGPDGEIIIGCVNSRQEYDAFFVADPTPTGPEVR